jgi:hypothetical protein
MAKGGGKAKFQQDTTVYARNDGLMYKAKILKVSESIVHYLIDLLTLVGCILCSARYC